MKKEYNFKKARIHEGSLLEGKGNKLQKTIRLDEDVFNLLKEGEWQAVPYQTLMNSLLKKAMTGDSIESRVARLEKKLGVKKSG